MFKIILKTLVQIPFLLYLFTILFCFGWRVFLREYPPALNLLLSFAPFLFLPVPLILIFGLVLHSRINIVFSLLTLGLFVFVYGSLFLPHQQIASAGIETEIIVLTMNLGPGVAKPENLATEIELANADFVAVQEMTPESANVLATRLDKKYPFRILDVDEHSTGLLSRFPIRSAEWFAPANEGRATLLAQIDVNGLPVHLFAPHPMPSSAIWFRDYPLPIGIDDSPQQRQLADIRERAKKFGTRVIIMGDLNVSDQTQAYPILATEFRDAFRETGWGLGFTFPSGLRIENLFPNSGRIGVLPVPGPLLRLDYIFHSDDLIARSAQVVCRGGSDHCYLMSRLGFQ
jgi:vancomycin resistance protein VanJ